MSKETQVEFDRKCQVLLEPLHSADDLQNWMYVFLDLFFPKGTIYPDSTHGPVDAMWRIYELMKTGDSENIPQVCMLASRDSYKCQKKGTLLLNRNGFTKIEDIKVGDVVWSGKNWRKVTETVHDGIKESIDFTLSNGLEISGSPIHRYWCLRDGVEQWIRSEDIIETDLICVNTNTGLANNNLITNQDEYDNGYFLGLLSGDGGTTLIDYQYSSRVCFTTKDEYLLQWMKEYCKEKLNTTLKNTSDKITYSITSKQAIEKIKHMGVKKQHSFEKTIPQYCYTSHSAMIGFINGLFDTDGTINSKNQIEISITAKTIVDELQKIFIGYGIDAKKLSNKRLYIQRSGIKQNHIVHRVYINSNYFERMFNIGFKISAKKAKTTRPPQIYDAHDTIPINQMKFLLDFCKDNHIIIRNRKYLKPKIGKYPTITVGKIKDLCNWLEENINSSNYNNEAKNILNRSKNIIANKFLPFVKKERSRSDFYDLTVEEDHSYWSNGVISHNTLSAAALEVLCLLHFKISIAHMAAISSQSDKAIQYVNAFFRKLKPYLEANGWKQSSDNKKMIAWLTKDLQEIYIRIVIATIAGANCIDPNSVVYTRKGAVLAKEIRQGDYLLTRDVLSGEDIWVRVMTTGNVLTEAKEFVFDDGSNLITSVGHKIFNLKGWVNSANVKISDKVVGRGGVIWNTNPKESLSNDFIKWNLAEILDSTMLGSAEIVKEDVNYVYQISTDWSNLDFLLKIKEIFEKNDIDSEIVGNKLRSQHIDFKERYNYYYKDGKKHIHDDWLRGFNLRNLAILVMDSGCLNKKDPSVYRDKPIDIKLRFSEKENYKVFTVINKLVNGGKLKNDKIYFNINESRDLTNDLSIHFVDSLKYKLCFSDDIRFCVDSGSHTDHNKKKDEFLWQKKEDKELRQKIEKQFNKKVIKINNLGIQKMVGIGIDPTLHMNHKSFYANGTLVHNSEHVPMLFIDEVDVVQDPRALKEAQMIPSTFGKYFPLTVYLSTRKFAGGLMEKTLKKTVEAGGEVLRWNIIDVTENISKEVAKVEEPKQIRYVSRNLPMEVLTEDVWKNLSDESKDRYERLEAYAGIADHPFLPVMRNYLVDREGECNGGLYKKLSATYNNFKQLDSDMADAQLLCNKPSASGLVYPRFDIEKNVLSVQEAWEKISGLHIPCDFNMLKQYLLDLGVIFIGGGDWGFSDWTVLPILALLPNGEIWHMDSFMEQSLEIDDIVKYGKEFQTEWNINKWYVDQNYPSYLKTLRKKAGWLVPKFKKDVAAGISALQSKIVNSANVRKYFIIDTPNNKFFINAFGEYRWKLDGKGEIIEGTPHHDKEGVSDCMDSIRYPFQNLFSKGVKTSFGVAGTNDEQKKVKLVTNKSELEELARQKNSQMMRQKVTNLATTSTNNGISKHNRTNQKGSKRILW